MEKLKSVIKRLALTVGSYPVAITRPGDKAQTEGNHMASLVTMTLNDVTNEQPANDVASAGQPVSNGSTQIVLAETVVKQRPLRIGGQSPLFSIVRV